MCVVNENADCFNPIRVQISTLAPAKIQLDAHVHQTPEGLLLELEPAVRFQPVAFNDFYQEVRRAVKTIVSADTTQELLDSLAQEVRALSGYDRVEVYRFDDDEHGTVLAESKASFMDSFLGQRFPASDIPKQARTLYLRNLVRLIVDVDDPLAQLIADEGDIDLSDCVLRSVSPIHLQYLRNMQVRGSFSVSIVQEGRLWGLVACHHAEPRFVDFHVRSVCESLSQIVSARLLNLESVGLIKTCPRKTSW
jgi:light-regulated signal transduction histidine kinase (bacteriophytochrome)